MTAAWASQPGGLSTPERLKEPKLKQAQYPAGRRTREQ